MQEKDSSGKTHGDMLIELPSFLLDRFNLTADNRLILSSIKKICGIFLLGWLYVYYTEYYQKIYALFYKRLKKECVMMNRKMLSQYAISCSHTEESKNTSKFWPSLKV